ncbi:hypothetical protein SAMN05421805_113125 [Saccharopolyspora antimicrobica]|uniref:Uncharacterized protein n=1 Tax=Saccharopolyspora antimicrobica TaxID=455193 RepID=A0A1I5GQ14_9PSEU|nr:hypothetical protein [Saccharopolyspora antimicrobica]RKT87412.1 hypothetical protein ATL45_5828 [Saccharopolyspora antimicrobica]SFO38078.1 hypothetical protein SAMN05421805_113125 [Saccharopolyspora antimicrobica]
MAAEEDADPIGTPVRLGYAVAALVIGGAWAFGWDVPLWQHALRLLVIVLVLPPIVHLARRRLRRPVTAYPPMRHLVVAKVLLVAGAVGLELLLNRWTWWAPFITAAALAATVAVGGPPWHRKLRQRAASVPRANPSGRN